MNQKGFIQNIVLIVVVLVVVFLSQQPNFRSVGGKVYDQGHQYLIKAEIWFEAHVWPHASQKVGEIGVSVSKEATHQKDNFVQNLWETIKNYFAEKFSKTFGTKVQ